MKKYIAYVLFSLFTMTCFAQTPADSKSAKKAQKEQLKKQKAEKAAEKKAQKLADERIEGKVPGHVYVCGCSFEFGDSVVYFSEIMEVDSITVTKKSKFLPYRSDFSQQFKDKLEGPEYNLKNQTSSVIFASKKEDVQKAVNKMKKMYLLKSHVSLVTIDMSKFKFVHPLDYYPSEN